MDLENSDGDFRGMVSGNERFAVGWFHGGRRGHDGFCALICFVGSAHSAAFRLS